MKFSERYGYTPVKDIIQLESMNDGLKNGLWSLLDNIYWSDTNDNYKYRVLERFFVKLWFSYFKQPTDEIKHCSAVIGQLRKYFFKSQWFVVYNFIEFIANEYADAKLNNYFIEKCNNLFERENAGYRFVDSKITPITDKQEINEIQQALDTERSPIKEHLRRALELLSDKTIPDYRNSIKESISAVESLVKQVVSEKNGTLGQLLKKLKENYNLPPVLASAFSKLYGYTSDKGGIRHAMIEESNINFQDAKFMLVICSAFINFVEGKIVNN